MKSIDNMKIELQEQNLSTLRNLHQKCIDTNNKNLEEMPDYSKFKGLDKETIESNIEELNILLDSVTDKGDNNYER